MFSIRVIWVFLLLTLACSAPAFGSAAICVDGTGPACEPSALFHIVNTTTGAVLGDGSVRPVPTGAGLFLVQITCDGSVNVLCDGSVITKPDPFISYSLSVTNQFQGPVTFTYTFTSPFISGPYNYVLSQHSSQVTDGGDGSVQVLPGVGGTIHQPSINGVPVAPANLGTGCTLTGAAGFSAGCNPGTDFYGSLVSPATGTLGVQLSFTLSPGDTYSTTGRFELTNVPEPGSILLILGGMLALYSLRLRSRNALLMTDTELKVMAALASIGLRRIPKNG